MTKFTKFPKIYRLGTEETLSILNADVFVQEKLDGANVSVWINSDSQLSYGSRNQEVTSFRGFPEYCNSHQGIQELLNAYPDDILYGEWLVKHTIEYKPQALNKFYLFDILTPSGFLTPQLVVQLAQQYEICYPEVFGEGKFYLEDLHPLVGKSSLTIRPNEGEGLVIKASWKNQWGDSPYAKLVRESFKEESACNFRAHSSEEFYFESLFTHKYVTAARLAKIVNKIEDVKEAKIAMSDIGRLISTMYHDILTEEITVIAKKTNKPFSFNLFQKMIANRTRELFHADFLATNNN